MRTGASRRGRPHVEQRAAHGERARVLDERAPHVAHAAEAGGELVAVELLLDHDELRVLEHLVVGDDLAAERRHGAHHHRPGQLDGQVEERGEAELGAAAVGVDVGVGARLVGEEEQDLAGGARVLRACAGGVGGLAEEERDVGREGPRRLDVGRDGDDLPARAGEGPDHERARAPGDAGDVGDPGRGRRDLGGEVARRGDAAVDGDLERGQGVELARRLGLGLGAKLARVGDARQVGERGGEGGAPGRHAAGLLAPTQGGTQPGKLPSSPEHPITQARPMPNPPARRTHRAFTVVGLILAMAMAALEATVVSTAMPSVGGSLGKIELYTWVTTAYLLTASVTVPLYGKLADMYGRKPLLLFGIAVFLIGSAASGAAESMEQLIVFRALQGLGAGAIQPIALTVVGDIFDLGERARMQGVFGASWGFFAMTGPAVGGFLVKLPPFGWRWVFYINLPFGLIAAALLVFALHERVERRPHRVDVAGALLLVGGIMALLVATGRADPASPCPRGSRPSGSSARSSPSSAGPPSRCSRSSSSRGG